MKKEVLRIRNFNLKYSNVINLKDICISFMEGESTALLGLASSGQDVFLQVIKGNEWSNNGSLYIDNKKIYNSEELSKYVHLITDLNYSIKNWTIAEYVGLVTDSVFPLIHRKKMLNEEIQQIFFNLGLDLDVTRKISDLSEFEKRIIDLVRAYKKNSRILVIEDEFDGASSEEIGVFKQIMDRIVCNRMTVLIRSHSETISSILADNLVIFKNGSVAKKCKKEVLQSGNDLEYFLLGESLASKRGIQNRDSKSDILKEKIIYRVENIITSHAESFDFSFGHGEIVSILALDMRKKATIFNILSGRSIEKNTHISINDKKYSFHSISDFVEKRIASSYNIGSGNEYLEKMSVGENILLPSMKKLSSLHYMFQGKKITKYLEKQIEVSTMKKEQNKYGANWKIRILLERWSLFKPLVLVCLEPFLHCDVYGISMIKSYFREIAESGTTVIIVKAREKDIIDISDRIIKV